MTKERQWPGDAEIRALHARLIEAIPTGSNPLWTLEALAAIAGGILGNCPPPALRVEALNKFFRDVSDYQRQAHEENLAEAKNKP